ncbi:QRFP-like peptide receptor [Glandiceps talaboti]
MDSNRSVNSSSLDLLINATESPDARNTNHWFVHKSVILSTLGICMILIVTGNLMVIIAVMLEPKLRRATSNILILSLAISDLLVGSYYIPSLIMWDEALHLMVNPIICNIDGFIQLTSTGASVFSLIAIASDRFRAIVTPFKPKLTRTHAAIMVAVAWICAMSYASYLPIIYEYQIYQYIDNNVTYIIPYCYHLPQFSLKMFRTIDFVVLFLMPFLILICLYAPMVYKLFFDKQPESSTGHKKKKAVKMLSMVVILFFTMWLPHYTLYLYVGYGNYQNTKANLRAVALFAILLNFSNSWVNPIIYACFNENFRNAYKNTLLCKIWQISRRVYPLSDPESDHGVRGRQRAHNVDQPIVSRNTLMTTLNTTTAHSFISSMPSSNGQSVVQPSPSFVGQNQNLLSPSTCVTRENFPK